VRELTAGKPRDSAHRTGRPCAAWAQPNRRATSAVPGKRSIIRESAVVTPEQEGHG
jgi:hypothetical protein